MTSVPISSDLEKDYPIRPVPFTSVKVEDEFWLPRLETNRKVTIPYCFRKCEETGRIDNFAKAGGLMEGEFVGIFFNDSDVFKVIEGAAYSLAIHPDPELDKYLDDLIAKIAAAQEDDGYLYTSRTINPKKVNPVSGMTRWSHLAHSHELYNIGHLYEAAVAHFQATGKRTLLDVAIKSANHVESVFGPDRKRDVPGHEEIEIGLVKLYRVTGDERYLNLCKFFLYERGKANGRMPYGPYCQDHKPVIEQDRAVGHAVRAGYLYSGMADAAVLTGDKALADALDKIWHDIVFTKLYLTGGIGARHAGEAFGEDYELPNATAYNETCAAIANALWNYRMFLLHGDSKYLDVLELIIYNGFLSGVSLSGDSFFYPNPLASEGQKRSPWFDCSCCPVNVARFVPSILGYVYAGSDDAAYVNLFIAGTGEIPLNGNKVRIRQETRYPWSGDIRLTVDPEKEGEFELRIRMPGWTGESPVPSDLYRYLNSGKTGRIFTLNGSVVTPEISKGFAVIKRTWKKGDKIEIAFPMEIRRVIANDKVKDDAGLIAFMRGPIVYCLEAPDNGGRVKHIAVPDDAAMTTVDKPELLGGVVIIKGKGRASVRAAEGTGMKSEEAEFTAIPYYAWAHRENGQMAVWLPRDVSKAQPSPIPTIASTSKITVSRCFERDTAQALNDQIEPKNSCDHDVPRLTWWDNKGTAEYVQYEFSKPAKVSGVEVYWFDDTGIGECRIPESWRVLYCDGKTWKTVTGASGFGIEKDKYNRVDFNAVQTDGLRLQVHLRPGVSGGILEWRVIEAK
ncbi:MAG TPA: glycoside hydrolase family 127 protein [Candidatus Brocadiia bacterium]|nr:glycoside hydrolase family 127 protein [Candidatus Brocadiia bacterium]